MTLAAKKPRAKTCINPACGVKFTPMQMGQKVCGWKCGLAVAPAGREKAQKALKHQEKKATTARKEKLKTKGDHTREAQQVFNQYIRERDKLAGYPCISSGQPLDWSPNQTDAGHYRSVGSAPHLRFDERNCHAQRKSDNRFLSGNAVSYRLGLIDRIGLQAVEELEADQEPRRYTIEDLQAIKALYRKKLRELKNATQQVE